MSLHEAGSELKELIGAPSASEKAVVVVDADVHPLPESLDHLLGYLPSEIRNEGWVSHLSLTASLYIPPTPSGGWRGDSVPASGKPAGSDPELMEKQLLREAGVDIAIMVPVSMSHNTGNPIYDAALCSATNSWLADTWLGRYNKHERYRGSILVAGSNPDASVAEIEKWAGHPYFVQVLMDPYLSAPLGQPQYREILATAARHGYPIALHINRSPGMPLLSPVGFASYYSEHHPLYTLVCLPHVVSFIVEGIFDKFPELKLVIVEGGSVWLGPLKWRMDHFWKEYGADVPWLRRPPSEYFKDHIRVTTQPMSEPDNLRDLSAYLEWMDAEHTLLFSSDYPHWDFDDPHWVLSRLPTSWRDRVLGQNSIELYGLPLMLPSLDAD